MSRTWPAVGACSRRAELRPRSTGWPPAAGGTPAPAPRRRRPAPPSRARRMPPPGRAAPGCRPGTPPRPPPRAGRRRPAASTSHRPLRPSARGVLQHDHGVGARRAGGRRWRWPPPRPGPPAARGASPIATRPATRRTTGAPGRRRGDVGGPDGEAVHGRPGKGRHRLGRPHRGRPAPGPAASASVTDLRRASAGAARRQPPARLGGRRCSSRRGRPRTG